MSSNITVPIIPSEFFDPNERLSITVTEISPYPPHHHGLTDLTTLPNKTTIPIPLWIPIHLGNAITAYTNKENRFPLEFLQLHYIRCFLEANCSEDTRLLRNIFTTRLLQRTPHRLVLDTEFIDRIPLPTLARTIEEFENALATWKLIHGTQHIDVIKLRFMRFVYESRHAAV